MDASNRCMFVHQRAASLFLERATSALMLPCFPNAATHVLTGDSEFEELRVR